MKDYSFGNYICTLRTGLGLSQFQLGNLVGVSDKAVSKWENGDAKPRIATCYRLAEVLGVNISELLSCNTTMPARKEQNKMKSKLWNEAHKRLAIYGERTPVLCWSRLAAEKAALEETDAILNIGVLSRIAEEAEKRGSLIIEAGQMSSSFAAWLLGATKVNPLPPHYRCPKCGKTEFISLVKDGFDLPVKQCSCGVEMIRDGHNLPYDGYAKAAQAKSGVYFHVSPDFKLVAGQIIKDFYQGKADILPVQFTDADDNLTKYTIFVVLSDRDDIPPVSKDGFWHADSAEFWYWWKDESIYEMICDDRIQKLQNLKERTKTTLPNPLEDLTPEIAETLYKQKCRDGTHAASATQHLCAEIPHNFDLLLKLDGFTHGSGAWCDQWVHNGVEMHQSNGAKLVEEGRATLLQIPAFREDIWNDIYDALSCSGIRYNGLALEVMENARKGVYHGRGMPDELAVMLHSLELPEWYPEYLKNVMYLFPKCHCISLLLFDLILEWYNEKYPNEYAQVFDSKALNGLIRLF